MPLRPAAPAELEDALTRAQLAVNDAIRACHDAPGTWRPIDSAPANTPVLLFIPDARHESDKIQVGSFGITDNRKKIWKIGNQFGFDVGTATYWHPLPEPPNA